MHSYVRTTNREYKRVLNANYSSWHQKIKLSSLCIICIYLQIFCNSKDSPICSYWMPRTNTVRFTAITSDMTRYLQAYSDAFGWYRYVHDHFRWRLKMALWIFYGNGHAFKEKNSVNIGLPLFWNGSVLKGKNSLPPPHPFGANPILWE